MRLLFNVFFLIFLICLNGNKIEGIDQNLERQTEAYYDDILRSHSENNEENDASSFLPAVDDLSISLINELSESLIQGSKKSKKTKLKKKDEETTPKLDENNLNLTSSKYTNSSVDAINQNQTIFQGVNESNLTNFTLNNDEIKFLEKPKDENISKTEINLDLPLFPKFTESSFFSEIKKKSASENNFNEKPKKISDESFFSKKLSSPPPLMDFKNLMENTRKYEYFKREAVNKKINKQMLIDKIAKFENLVEQFAQKSKGKLKEGKKDIIFKNEISIERNADNATENNLNNDSEKLQNDASDLDGVLGPQVNIFNENDVYRKLGPVPHFFSFE